MATKIGTILMGAAMLLRAWTPRIRALLTVGLLLMALALIWSHARSPLLGVLAGALVFIAALQGWPRRISWVLLCGPVLALVAVPSLHEHAMRIFTFSRNVTRLNLWESSWLGIKARPLLGFGPGNFSEMMGQYEVEGYYNTRAHSHNDFLMHGVNAGLLGLLAALVLLLVVSFLLWKVWRRGGASAGIALGCVAVQLGISVAGLFQVFQTDDEVELLLYFVLGCGLALCMGRHSSRSRV